MEYEIDGIVQVNVDEESGRTFHNCLRAILRQDPDKVLVGEVRDVETAKIAIEASLTGRLVFTTPTPTMRRLPSPALVDMGIEPSWWRLRSTPFSPSAWCVRFAPNARRPTSRPKKNCPRSIYARKTSPVASFYYGKGCSYCNDTGYRGRTALFEIIDMNNNIRDQIINQAPTAKIRRGTPFWHANPARSWHCKNFPRPHHH